MYCSLCKAEVEKHSGHSLLEIFLSIGEAASNKWLFLKSRTVEFWSKEPGNTLTWRVHHLRKAIGSNKHSLAKWLLVLIFLNPWLNCDNVLVTVPQRNKTNRKSISIYFLLSIYSSRERMIRNWLMILWKLESLKFVGKERNLRIWKELRCNLGSGQQARNSHKVSILQF